MADRRRRTLLLVESRDWLIWLPSPRPVRAGFVPGAERPCGSCGLSPAPGWVVDRFGRRSPCQACGGAVEPTGKSGQWVARDGGSGTVAFDPMDVLELPVGSASTFATARPRATKRCDACGGDGAHGNGRRCDVCGGSGRRELHAFDLALDLRGPDEDPVDRAIERRDQAGSYRELDRALDQLRRRNRAWLRSLLELTDLGGVSNGHVALAERGLAFVVARMPDPVRVPAAVLANARERREWARRARGRGTSAAAIAKRDAEIRLALRRGTPHQRVAFEFGLSVSTVYRVAGEGAS